MNVIRLLSIFPALLLSYVFAAEVTDGVYSPIRTETGEIDRADFASLPLNQWVKIKNSSFNALQDTLVDSFNKTYGTDLEWRGIASGPGSVRNAVNGWTGGIHDKERSLIVLVTPGGHSNGIVTGIWAWDILKAQWHIVRAPTNPFAVGFEWPKSYRQSSSTMQFPREHLPDDLAAEFPNADILPDGTPTARHQYLGDVHDTNRDAYHTTRQSFFTYSIPDDTYKARVFSYQTMKDTKTGYPPVLVFDEFHDVIYGYHKPHQGERYSWFDINPDTGAMTKTTGAIDTNFGARGGNMARMPGVPTVLIIAANKKKNGEVYSVLDLQTRAFEKRSAPVDGAAIYDSSNSMPALVYVPEWKRWLRRMTRLKSKEKCGWYLFDHETGKQEKVAFDPNPACAPYIGRKLVYSEPLRALVLISENRQDGEAVWYMRVGDTPPTSVPSPEPARDDLQRQVDAADTVKVEPGSYYDSAVMRGSKDVDFAGVEIQGATKNGAVVVVGGPHVVRNLKHAQAGRSGLWLQTTPDVTVENPDISNQQFGIVSSNDGGKVIINGGQVSDGRGGKWGKVHNVYLGEIDWAEVHNFKSIRHHNAGHLFKSRADVNIITGSLFQGDDSHHSRILDFPCGGYVEIKNSVMRQSPDSDNNDLIAIAVEKCAVEDSILVIENTKWIASKPKAKFLTSKHNVRIICRGTNEFVGVAEPDCDPVDDVVRPGDGQSESPLPPT